MVQLGKNLAAVLVHRVGQLFTLSDMIVLSDAEVVDVRDGVHIVHAGEFVDDKADAAFGPFLIVADQLLGGAAEAVGKISAHRHHDRPVFQDQRPDAALFK